MNWKTLGPTQRALLKRARESALHCTTENERNSALRLNERGWLRRGETAYDFTITERGKELYDANARR